MHTRHKNFRNFKTLLQPACNAYRGILGTLSEWHRMRANGLDGLTRATHTSYESVTRDRVRVVVARRWSCTVIWAVWGRGRRGRWMRCFVKCLNWSRVSNRLFVCYLFADTIEEIRFSEFNVTSSMEIWSVKEGCEKEVCRKTFEFVLWKIVIRGPAESLKLSDKCRAKGRGKILGLKGVR